MDSSLADVVEDLLNTISLLPEDDREKVLKELGELVDNIPELPLEGGSAADIAQAASPSSSPLNSKERNDGKKQDTEPTLDLPYRDTEQLDSRLAPPPSGSLSRGTSGVEPDPADDFCSGATSTVRLYSGASTGSGSASAADKGSIQDERKSDGSSVLNPSLKALRGPRATQNVQATHVPNPSNLEVKERDTATAEVSSSGGPIRTHLLKPSNAYEPNSVPFPGEDPSNERLEHQSEPGTYMPSLRRNAGNQPSVPPVMPMIINGRYYLPNVKGQVPFAFPNSSGTQTSSFQGNSIQTSFPYPPVPIPYPDLPAVLLPGYGQLPIPIPATSTAPQGPVRVPLRNSKRVNVDVTEAPRTSEAGPSRAGRKRAKETASGEPIVYVCDLPNCPLPGKQFYDKRELLRHQNQTKAHSRTKFYCSVCNAEFPRKDARKRHFENKHER